MAAWLSTAVSGSARRVQSDWVLAGIDACLVTASWVAALILRYDGRVPDHAWAGIWSFLPLALVVSLICNGVTGLYSGVWQHASIYEARRVLSAQLAALLVCAPAVFLLGRPVPLSVPLIASVLAVGLVGAVRFQSRLFAFRRQYSSGTVRILVIGAGSAGVSLARDVNEHNSGAKVVAFLDDDRQLSGRKLRGVPVQGTIDDLAEVSERLLISYAVMAIPSASPTLLSKIASLAEESGVVLRVVPPLAELVNGQVRLGDVRDIEIKDLLTRTQVQTDLAEVRSLIGGKRVLITGAGGSIGSEIARQVAQLGAARVVLVDHDETHLFDTAAGLPETAVQRLADVREPYSIEQLFRQERPEIVFHAAAHKHVPLLEDHPVEAVQTNVFGTRTVVSAARDAGVERFVFISTDKAVRPSSVMGATKSIGEKIVLTDSGSMVACAVRFGNVLGSRGSVVPTFVKQIRSGGPVTVTDARMTRYFMSIPEAVRLVLNAAALSAGREIFMLDMGDPVPIIDLAHRLIRLSGNRPGLDVEIRVTGIRPGEKLAEELRTADEQQLPTSHPSIVRLLPEAVHGGYLDKKLRALDVAVVARDDQATRAALGSSMTNEPKVDRLPAQRTQGPDALITGGNAWT